MNMNIYTAFVLGILPFALIAVTLIVLVLVGVFKKSDSNGNSDTKLFTIPCTATGASCPSGDVCEPTTGKCVSALGQSCILNSDCFQPAVCESPAHFDDIGPSICLGTGGAICSNGTQCLSGTCNISAGDSTGTCTASSR